jgi:hypothetical protein
MRIAPAVIAHLWNIGISVVTIDRFTQRVPPLDQLAPHPLKFSLINAEVVFHRPRHRVQVVARRAQAMEPLQSDVCVLVDLELLELFGFGLADTLRFLAHVDRLTTSKHKKTKTRRKLADQIDFDLVGQLICVHWLVEFNPCTATAADAFAKRLDRVHLATKANRTADLDRFSCTVLI